MTNIYYTARTGKRNANGHTITRGTVYKITRGDSTTPHGEDALESIGDYAHQSDGADIARSVLFVCDIAGIPTGTGYFGNYREYVNLIEL